MGASGLQCRVGLGFSRAAQRDDGHGGDGGGQRRRGDAVVKEGREVRRKSQSNARCYFSNLALAALNSSSSIIPFLYNSCNFSISSTAVVDGLLSSTKPS